MPVKLCLLAAPWLAYFAMLYHRFHGGNDQGEEVDVASIIAH